jgi:hypothetical protein
VGNGAGQNVLEKRKIKISGPYWEWNDDSLVFKAGT